MKQQSGQDNGSTLGTAAIPFVVEGVVFLCGAVVMVLELVGSRLLAPYFGNSLFVWTSLIGVMLGFMALGNYLGGRLGDRNLSTRVLFRILAAASLSTSAIALTEGFFIPLLARGGSGKWPAVASAVALFAIPSTVFGMVSPYSIRLRMHSISDSGSTVGSLYALSTVGSILGTFAAGFWLIAVMGSHALLVWMAAVPAVLSLLFVLPLDRERAAVLAAVLLALAVSVFFSRSSIESFDTPYDRYFLRSGTDTRSGRPVLGLTRQVDGGAESMVYADDGEPVMAPYMAFYDAALGLVPRVDRTLVIGGGAFSYPRHQLLEHPDSSTDVVEIDPRLVDVSEASFFLRKDPRLTIIVEDGRMFLNGATRTYNAIFIDAFKSKGSVPYQLTTLQSMRRCYDLLDGHGVLAINIGASTSGVGSEFVWAEYSTLKKVFPQVEIFVIPTTRNAEGVENVVMIAGKDPTANLGRSISTSSSDLAAFRVGPRVKSARVMTDDFAPVDQYLMGL